MAAGSDLHLCNRGFSAPIGPLTPWPGSHEGNGKAEANKDEAYTTFAQWHWTWHWLWLWLIYWWLACFPLCGLPFFFLFPVYFRALSKVCHDFNGGWLPSLIHADLLRFNFKFNNSHGFSTFCITKTGKLNQSKNESQPKKCVKEFAYSLWRLKQNENKGRAKFNLRKSCFRYGFIRWISQPTYIYIYYTIFFRCTKGCFWGQTRRVEKSGEIHFASLFKCLKVAWFITPEAQILAAPQFPNFPSFDMHTGQIELWGVCRLLHSPLTTLSKDIGQRTIRGRSSRIILPLCAFVAPNLRLLKQNVDNTLIYYAKGGGK